MTMNGIIVRRRSLNPTLTHPDPEEEQEVDMLRDDTGAETAMLQCG